MRKALLLCVVLMSASLLVSAGDDQTLYGYITCSACGAKGATDSHRDCMEKCIAKGADVMVVTEDTKAVIRIDNPSAVSGHYAHRMALFGYFKGQDFHVISARIL